MSPLTLLYIVLIRALLVAVTQTFILAHATATKKILAHVTGKARGSMASGRADSKCLNYGLRL